MMQTFGGVDFSRVPVAGKVQGGLSEFERTRLEARKVDNCCGWARKLSKGRDRQEIWQRYVFEGP